MALITVPSQLRFTDVEIWCDAVSNEMRSPFNGKRQVNKLPYDLWNFEGEILPLDPVDAGPMKSFLMQLAGKVNTFKLLIPGSKYPLSAYANAVKPKCVNTGVTGTSVIANGITAGATLLKNGDHFNIGDELKVASADIVANGAGQATVTFMPPLRAPTVAGVTELTIQDPYVILAATRDDIARWKIKPPVRSSFKLEALEVL